MTHTPDLMPVLSRGKHRRPSKGACFMELASYLAGERWSDHPRCTHPVLACLARDVNDQVSDEARSRLAPMIPSVIGLTGDDPRVDAWIAREAALTALPLAPASKQGVAAVGLLHCERYLARVEGRAENDFANRTRAALDATPLARDWAREFEAMGIYRSDNFRKRSAPAIVQSSVAGIAAACVPDVDDILVDLLARTIEHCRIWLRPRPTPVADDRWRDACSFTTR